MLVLALVVSTSFFVTAPMISPQLRRIMAHPGLLLTSLAVNLLLVTALILVRTMSPDTAAAPPAPAVPAQMQAVAKAKLLVNEARPAAFHWRQLDAPDFPTFVKNLRAIGCPEATIRDIISGELREIHQLHQQELAQSPQSRSTGGTAGAPRLMKSEFEELQDEQERQLAALLGPAPAGTATGVENAMADGNISAAAAGISSAAGTSAANPKMAALAQTPVVFLATSSTQQAPPAQAAAIDQMKSDFSNAVQASGVNPGNPEYRLRWNQAQIDSNERFSSLFGGDRFIQTQQEAVQEANAKP